MSDIQSPYSDRELATLMLHWADCYDELMAIQSKIELAVLAKQATVTVGDVRATFNSGRKTYNYEAAASEAPVIVIAEHTTPKVDWKAVCEEIGLMQEEIEFTQSDPSVTIKILK